MVSLESECVVEFVLFFYYRPQKRHFLDMTCETGPQVEHNANNGFQCTTTLAKGFSNVKTSKLELNRAVIQ